MSFQVLVIMLFWLGGGVEIMSPPHPFPDTEACKTYLHSLNIQAMAEANQPDKTLGAWRGMCIEVWPGEVQEGIGT